MARWLRQAKEVSDPFEKFFSLWVVLLVAGHRMRNPESPNPTAHNADIENILAYFQENRRPVLEAIQENRSSIVLLADCLERLVTIKDAASANIHDKIKFTEYFLRIADLKAYANFQHISRPENVVGGLGEVVNVVKNILFYGSVDFEVKLLNLVNPVLAAALQRCQSP